MHRVNGHFSVIFSNLLCAVSLHSSASTADLKLSVKLLFSCIIVFSFSLHCVSVLWMCCLGAWDVGRFSVNLPLAALLDTSWHDLLIVTPAYSNIKESAYAHCIPVHTQRHG